MKKYKEELCGDKVEIEKFDQGCIVVLSDGLGSGVKANILATLTSKIAVTMMKNGLSIEEVVDTIINTLPTCKVRELAYSTFTIIYISNTGECYIARFDNPEVLIKRNGNIDIIEGEEVIISGRRVIESKFNLKKDDIIVSFSDGVLNAGNGKNLNLGWNLNSVSEYIKTIPSDISSISLIKKVIGTCDNLYMKKPGDDTTVLAVKIMEKKHVTLLTGPPLDPKDDKIVVQNLIKSTGKKIVCGGTTAEIVEREMDTEFEMDMKNITGDIPPIGYIKNIDLVTEGMITLKKVLKVLDEYKNNKYHIDDIFKHNKEQNGAYRILKILIDECTHIDFLLGRSVNSAYENFDFQENLATKVEIVEKIKDKLIELGKVVNVFYY
ncbi:MAG: serine/threonine-protein phosphatase [Tepidibacter sp.]|uniref:SpoIIE family protein phosphatase n=1 Tax=Tepidibacter sp. TaxID=2529387 RepID=UPI0025D4946B|nr:SpoIIE family protein phosphatase [Tepidibacter sp.]MCT4508781.1 serine/threonine-protein phosphatase [Tepidibacter sp.]